MDLQKLKDFSKELKLVIGAAAGSGVAFFGIIFRLSAKTMSWPREYSYSGPREATNWAIQERALQDISLALMAFGFALLLVTFYSWLQDQPSRD